MNVETDSRPLLEARGLYHIYRSEQLETIAVRGTDITVAAGEPPVTVDRSAVIRTARKLFDGNAFVEFTTTTKER